MEQRDQPAGGVMPASTRNRSGDGDTVTTMSTRRGMPRWPLFLIASPAAVAVWSGWVALGGMCGFGVVNLLPGIGHGFSVNTAITLPVGVEAYGAYALGAWLIPGTPERARAFARRSAVGSLILGMCGQVIYHLLAAAHSTRAPWPVTVAVSCMPVVTLGFGAALTHLLRTTEDAAGVTLAAVQVTADATPEAAAAPPVQVTPEQVSGQVPELTSSQPPAPVSGQPGVTVPATPQVRPRRKPAARPPRISDADLKREVKAEFDADPSVSVNAAAKNLNRSRDRVRPLLEQIRSEANVSPITARR